MQKSFFGNDVLAWFLGAADREGLTELADEKFPFLAEDIGPVSATLSPAAKQLTLCLSAAQDAILRYDAEVLALDSISKLETWRTELKSVGELMARSLG